MAGAARQSQPPAAGQAVIQHRNETLLAGLRPGRDTFAMAEKRFKPRNLFVEANSSTKEWRDQCSGRSIRLALDAKTVIQSVTITTLGS